MREPKPTPLWGVVIWHKSRRGCFWAHPNTLTTKKQAEKYRDELRAAPDKLDARIRFFGYVMLGPREGGWTCTVAR